MSQISKPTDINKIWASGGDVLTPSDTKIATGWVVEVPPRQYFNYIDQKQDYAIAHINQHGVAVWDNVTEYQADKSYTQGPTNGTIYRCVSTHTNQNPETDVTNTYWEIAFAAAGEFYTKVETDNLYLAKTQNLADLPNTATARTNLNVYSKTETYTKTEVDAKTTVASVGQAQALSSNTVLISALRLADAFKGPNQSLAASGYQKIPGGLIVQWGQVVRNQGTSGNHSFNTPFPTLCFMVVTSKGAAINLAGEYAVGANAISNSEFTVSNTGPGSDPQAIYWVALGY